RARIEAQINKIYYDEKIPVELLVKRLCDFKQTYTQFGGVRPFGTALLIAGIDDLGVQLFETDPSGALMAYKAGAIGEGRNTVLEIFEKKYRDEISEEEVILLALEALRKATEGELLPHTIEIGIIRKGEVFRKFSSEEVHEYIAKLKKKSE
ncbi:MAG: proteasome subunit alpha, partial [Candidatus Thermoplasmatota archaeon]|nr:proteasome subunit alpha [Candidatus Thermoplasmatota archaeon]